MSGTGKNRWDTIAEKNRAAVRANAAAVMADTKYDRLRTPAALRALAVSYVVITVVMASLWIFVAAWAGILGMFALIVTFLLLRVAVRSQADMPDEVLDERMVAERDRVYLHAYRLSSTVFFLGASALFATVAFTPSPATLTLDYDELSAVLWIVLSVVMGAPSLVLAIRAASRGGVESAQPSEG